MKEEIRMNLRFLACINTWSVVVVTEKGKSLGKNSWGNIFHFGHMQGFEVSVRYPVKKCPVGN